jgi:hypothetical protein
MGMSLPMWLYPSRAIRRALGKVNHHFIGNVSILVTYALIYSKFESFPQKGIQVFRYSEGTSTLDGQWEQSRRIPELQEL